MMNSQISSRRTDSHGNCGGCRPAYCVGAKRLVREGMPQMQLPIFPAGMTEINSRVPVEARDGQVCYVYGHLPVEKLCDALNETRTVFPGTDLTLTFKIGSSQIPAAQEV
jgi:hypothetical protein